MYPDDIGGDYRWHHLYEEGYSVEEAYESWRDDLPRAEYEKVKAIEEGK